MPTNKAIILIKTQCNWNFEYVCHNSFFFQNIESNTCLKRVCFSMKEYNWQQRRSTKCTKLSYICGVFQWLRLNPQLLLVKGTCHCNKAWPLVQLLIQTTRARLDSRHDLYVQLLILTLNIFKTHYEKKLILKANRPYLYPFQKIFCIIVMLQVLYYTRQIDRTKMVEHRI